MAKVIGVILTIIGGLGTLGNIFLYLNSSAHLRYNPSSPDLGILDVGLAAQIVLFGLILLAGRVMVKYSTEPDIK